MLTTTLSQLHQLKLSGMAKALSQQLEQPGQYQDYASPNGCNC